MKNKYLLFIVLFILIGVYSCSVEKNLVVEKELKVISFGIKTNNNEPLNPGQKVNIYAKVNKTKNISFNWNIANQYYENCGEIIEWTIPSIAGEYPIKVTAIDKTNNNNITYEEKLIVGEKYAELEVKDFKKKITIKTTAISKEITTENETIMEIESENNIIKIKLIDNTGETNYVVENGDIYQIEESKKIFGFSSKKKLLIENIISSMKNKDEKNNDGGLLTYSIDYYQKIFGTPVSIDGTKYTFVKKIDKSEISVIIDTKLNRLIQMSIIDGLFKNVTAMKYTYELKDGHINLTKIESAEASIYTTITDVTYTTMIIEDIE